MTRNSLPAVAVFAVVCGLLLIGCGAPKSATVRGKVVKNGQPVEISKKTMVTIMFAPTEQPKGKGRTYPGNYNHADGTYSVTVPTGSYRAGVTITDPGAVSLSSPIDKSKVYEIKEDQQIDLELPK